MILQILPCSRVSLYFFDISPILYDFLLFLHSIKILSFTSLEFRNATLHTTVISEIQFQVQFSFIFECKILEVESHHHHHYHPRLLNRIRWSSVKNRPEICEIYLLTFDIMQIGFSRAKLLYEIPNYPSSNFLNMWSYTYTKKYSFPFLLKNRHYNHIIF